MDSKYYAPVTWSVMKLYGKGTRFVLKEDGVILNGNPVSFGELFNLAGVISVSEDGWETGWGSYAFGFIPPS